MKICACGHHRLKEHQVMPKFVDIMVGTQTDCVTTDQSQHVAFEAKRRYGLLTIRIPFFVGVTWLRFLCWMKSPEARA